MREASLRVLADEKHKKSELEPESLAPFGAACEKKVLVESRKSMGCRFGLNPRPAVGFFIFPWQVQVPPLRGDLD